MKFLITGLLLPFFLTGCSSKKAAAPVAATELTTLGVTVPEGQLMIFNASDAYYTFVLRGEDIRSTQRVDPSDPPALFVDSLFLQMTTLPISRFIDSDISRMTDLQILEKHQRYEADYLGSLTRRKYTIHREPIRLGNGRQCLIWLMEVEGLPTQILISTAVRPHVLLLSTPLFTGGKAEEDRILEKLMGAMESIRQYSEPVDPLVIQDSVAKVIAATREASSGGD